MYFSRYNYRIDDSQEEAFYVDHCLRGKESMEKYRRYKKISRIITYVLLAVWVLVLLAGALMSEIFQQENDSENMQPWQFIVIASVFLALAGKSIFGSVFVTRLLQREAAEYADNKNLRGDDPLASLYASVIEYRKKSCLWAIGVFISLAIGIFLSFLSEKTVVMGMVCFGIAVVLCILNVIYKNKVFDRIVELTSKMEK